METKVDLKITTERSMTTIAKLLLILNRKQLSLSNIWVSEDNIADKYKYTVRIFGEENTIHHTVKLINKQVGVFNISFQSTHEKKKEQAIPM